MKKRHITLGIMFLGAGWLSLFGDNAPATSVVEAVPRTGSAGLPATAAAMPAQVILELRGREELIGNEGGTGEALFASHSWTPPPPPPVQVKALPPPKPSAPPLPFTYLGKKLENGKWEAYLARGSDTYIVREQSMIDGMYRAESITPSTLTITYLPLKQVQTLTIGGDN